MEFQAWWIWMALAALFIIGEIFTAGFFLLWFGIGSGIAGLMALAGLGAGWQWAGFLVIAIGLFLISRRFADRFTHEQPPGIGADRFIGKQGMVLQEIDRGKNTGRVRIDNEEWRAETEGAAPIPEGSEVAVVRVVGTRLVVRRL